MQAVVSKHIFHCAGYYPAGAAPKSNQQAQIDMVEETLKWAGVTSVDSVSYSCHRPASNYPFPAVCCLCVVSTHVAAAHDCMQGLLPVAVWAVLQLHQVFQGLFISCVG